MDEFAVLDAMKMPETMTVAALILAPWIIVHLIINN
jgi:hypothetical protein